MTDKSFTFIASSVDAPQVRRVGFSFGLGLMQAWGVLMLGALALWALANVLGLNAPDDTDAGLWDRSGMSLHTDHLTGCQYLSRRDALTPRLGADGRQICVRR